MAKKLKAADMLESANATAAREIIEAAIQNSTDEAERSQKKSNSQSTPKTSGRPKGKRTEGMNIKLTAEHKEYLRQRSFELSTIKKAVTASDIIGELIDADMKKRNRAKK